MKTVRGIAVVGCGSVATGAHLPNIAANPRLKLVATCDRDERAAREASARFGAARWETDWRRVVADRQVDLILLATHTGLRGELIIAAMQAGKPVYTEKPLAPSVSQMADILRVHRQTGVPVCVGHNRRSSPAVLELRRLAEKARSLPEGEPPSVDRRVPGIVESLPEARGTQILIRVNDDLRSWKPWVFQDAEGILFAEMVHFIDLALWLEPSPPAKVFAMGSAMGNFTLAIGFQDGSTATLHQTAVGHFNYPKELVEVSANFVTVAMEQHVEVRQWGIADEPHRRVFPFTGREMARTDGIAGYYEALAEAQARRAAGRTGAAVGVNKGHAAHLDRFVTHLEGGGENPCPIDGAVTVNRLALKLVESVRTGLAVAVGPEDLPAPA